MSATVESDAQKVTLAAEAVEQWAKRVAETRADLQEARDEYARSTDALNGARARLRELVDEMAPPQPEPVEVDS